MSDPTISCTSCGESTPMLFTKLCNPCWERRNQIGESLDLALLAWKARPWSERSGVVTGLHAAARAHRLHHGHDLGNIAEALGVAAELLLTAGGLT